MLLFLPVCISFRAEAHKDPKEDDHRHLPEEADEWEPPAHVGVLCHPLVPWPLHLQGCQGPGTVCQSVSPVPLASDIYMLGSARWGPGRCLQQDHISDTGGSTLALCSNPPCSLRGRTGLQHLFSQQLAAVMSPASPGTPSYGAWVSSPAPCSVLPHTLSYPLPGPGPDILTMSPWQPPCLHRILLPSPLVLLCMCPSPTPEPRIPSQPESLGAGPAVC